MRSIGSWFWKLFIGDSGVYTIPAGLPDRGVPEPHLPLRVPIREWTEREKYLSELTFIDPYYTALLTGVSS